MSILTKELINFVFDINYFRTKSFWKAISSISVAAMVLSNCTIYIIMTDEETNFATEAISLLFKLEVISTRYLLPKISSQFWDIFSERIEKSRLISTVKFSFQYSLLYQISFPLVLSLTYSCKLSFLIPGSFHRVVSGVVFYLTIELE